MTTATRTLRTRHRLLIPAVAGAVALVALVALVLTSPSGRTTGSTIGSAVQLSPSATVASFVRSYVSKDGRVVRADQGGDTVSEGQAYAMLMTAAVGDRTTFVSVWNWTRKNLLLPDGLLAWHWQHGSIVGREPASDADLGAAAALVMASRRFADPAFLTDAHSLAQAILSHETGPSGEGPTLVAGPWAAAPTEYVDPSYLSPAELDQVASAFGAPWPSIASTAAAQLEALTARGDLPSDWAVIASDRLIHPAAAPGSPGAPAVYGFDAVRAPVWMAASCNAGLRASAAGLLPALRRGGGEVQLDLGGHPDPGVADPVGRIALAAAEWAAADRQQAWSDLAQAERAERLHPTYYASAWVALTTLAFDGRLETCGPKPG